MKDIQVLIEQLRTRATIRRQIASRKSVQEGKSDRLSDLLDEAALNLEAYSAEFQNLYDETESLREELAKVMAEGQEQWRLKNVYFNRLVAVNTIINSGM